MRLADWMLMALLARVAAAAGAWAPLLALLVRLGAAGGGLLKLLLAQTAVMVAAGANGGKLLLARGSKKTEVRQPRAVAQGRRLLLLLLRWTAAVAAAGADCCRGWQLVGKVGATKLLDDEGVKALAARYPKSFRG